MTARSLTILGATGSIGTSTLDIVRHHPEAFTVDSLTAHTDAPGMIKLAQEFSPKFIAMSDQAAAAAVQEALSGQGIEVAAGPEAQISAAERPTDMVMAAIVGAAGMEPTLAAVKRGTTVMLANKECLVCAGDLMLDAVKKAGARLLPVDSEHNAIYQVFHQRAKSDVLRLILTASGGPFRGASKADLATVTPEQAVSHPNWSMGQKISVDSATLMNKGLEVIEAYYLFPIEKSQIDVVVHPQSIIHSMVEYADGSILSQMGPPDMRVPIAHCMGHPNRLTAPITRLDFANVGPLEFEAPDLETFECLKLARDALNHGGTAPLVLNAANEVAVAAFLEGQISFLQIPETVRATLDAQADTMPPHSIANVAHLDAEARKVAVSHIRRTQ